MLDWIHEIPKCFSPDALVFAGTPDQAMYAKSLRAQLQKAGIPAHLAESEIEDWLHQQTSNTGQLFEQMARVREFFAA